MSSGVTKRRFSQFVPVQRDALADRAADAVDGHEDPLRTCDVRLGQLGELGDKWISHVFVRHKELRPKPRQEGSTRGPGNGKDAGLLAAGPTAVNATSGLNPYTREVYATD